MARHACQYVRPDVCAVGGITTSKKICALAEAHDVLVIPHNPLGPVSTAACLQICASIPNLGIEELPGFCLNGAEDRMVKEPLRFENGCMLIPEAPGIGVELADDAEELSTPPTSAAARPPAVPLMARSRTGKFAIFFPFCDQPPFFFFRKSPSAYAAPTGFLPLLPFWAKEATIVPANRNLKLRREKLWLVLPSLSAKMPRMTALP